MDASNLTTPFEKEWEVLFLTPSLIHSYLYYKIGAGDYLLAATVASVAPAYLFTFGYVLDIDEWSDFNQDTTLVKIVLRLYIPSMMCWIFLYLIGIQQFYLYLDNDDLLMVLLFIGAIFVAIVGGLKTALEDSVEISD